MTTVIISSDRTNGRRFRAIAGKRESFGDTMGEALDALTESLETDEDGAVVLVQDFQPDEFFSEEQQRRLSYLMSKWRSARDRGSDLSSTEQEELEKLTAAELEGSERRARKLSINKE